MHRIAKRSVPVERRVLSKAEALEWFKAKNDPYKVEIISELENDAIWAEVSAVRSGNVYIFTGQADNVFCRPGPRMVDAVELMAKILHPEVFDAALPHVIGDNYTDWVTSTPVGEAVTGSEVNSPALIGLIQARTDWVSAP